MKSWFIALVSVLCVGTAVAAKGAHDNKYLYKNDPKVGAIVIDYNDTNGDFLSATNPRVVEFYDPYCVRALVVLSVFPSKNTTGTQRLITNVSFNFTGSLSNIQVALYRFGQRGQAGLSKCRVLRRLVSGAQGYLPKV